MGVQQTKTNKDRDSNAIRCPKCGRALKAMRCRIDDPELYCPDCRRFFSARVIHSSAR